MFNALPYATGFVLPLVVVASAGLGGGWTFLPLVVLYGVVPALDALSGQDGAHLGPEERARLERNRWYRAVTWAWIPAQGALIGWALAHVASSGPTALETIGLTLSVGLTGGAVGITFAHELVHRAGRLERALGEVILLMVTYPHFAIEHVLGHHRHVATPRDPATARAGESVYAFLPRSIGGGVRSAWALEVERLRDRGRSPLHPSNRMLRYGVLQAAVYAGVGLAWGTPGLVVFAAQSIVAFCQLEVINYIEHYGLARRELAPGRYERVGAHHSWDSSHRLTNWMLINLPRHAEHHLLASRRYQLLEAEAAAPRLPAGYGAMVVLALVPGLWRRVMDPRLTNWRAAHAGQDPGTA